MIGFKTIDDYTFDECVDFINQQDSSHPLWEEINLRHAKLYNKYQREDDSCFKACNTYADYENYIVQFSNLNGASKYTPIYIEQAKEQMSKLPDLRQSWIKRNFGFLSKYASLRNPITNLFLYVLLLASLIGGIFSIPASIWSYNLWAEDNWSFCDAYGKGCIPGLLLCIVTFIGVLNLIRWNKYGISVLIIGYILVLTPLMWNEFGGFIAFSTPALLGCLILWGIMCVKKNGISSWFCCVDIPKALSIAQFVFIMLWGLTVVALPFIAAFNVGFNNNLYANGTRVIDAYLNNSPYYSYDLYQKILLGTDFKDDTYDKKNIAELWLTNAQYLDAKCSWEDYRLDDELSVPMLFLNNLIFILNNKSNQDALNYIDSMKNNVDMSLIFQYLNGEKFVMGEYEYYRPNKERITSILNQADIYEKVEVTVAE